MAVFFFVAPFNNDNLQIFRHVSEEVACEGNDDKRHILERSNDYDWAVVWPCLSCPNAFWLMVTLFTDNGHSQAQPWLHRCMLVKMRWVADAVTGFTVSTATLL